MYEEESEDNSLSDIGEGAKDDKSDIEDGAEDDKSNFEEDAEDNKTNTQEEEEDNNASGNDGGDVDQGPSTSTKKKVLKKKKVVESPVPSLIRPQGRSRRGPKQVLFSSDDARRYLEQRFHSQNSGEGKLMKTLQIRG